MAPGGCCSSRAGSPGAAADELAGALGTRLAGRFDRAEAMRVAGETATDCVVAIGGGSAIGLAKALLVRTGMPQVAVPSTYAGSEVTPVLGETENGVKATRRDPSIEPGTVVYDPEPTSTMAPGLTPTSSLNALAHAVEALWAPNATAVTDALATESIDGILTALRGVLDAPSAPTGRERLQQSAWLDGLCLARTRTRMRLHHQLAHALGGTFDLPHAELHAMLLAHAPGPRPGLQPSLGPEGRRPP
ncbi:iron-containing alcohol dehydrogenase [Streptomyces sp. NPDC058092]|uniref:iron-containing alcohol dehydrogenase n=1 Tax=Streptomyces sp. NPDC058092 TaxID=3346336 RepID=UPI0036EDB638